MAAPSGAPLDVGPWGLGVNRAGHLVLGGCDVVEIAHAYGTPLHLADEAALRHAYRSFVRAFAAYPRTRVFYSYKSNCVPGLLAVLHSEGCGAEVISPYELWLARRLGVPPAGVVYNGPNKSSEDLRTAIELGVGLINVDSVSEIRRLLPVAEALRRPVDIGIRIYPAIGWKAHFGVQPHHDSLVGVCRELAGTGLINVRTLHVHIGTGIRATRDYERVIRLVCTLMRDLGDAAGIRIDRIDLGGGFGVPTVKTFTLPELALYRLFARPPRPPRSADCPSVERFGEAIATALAHWCGHHGLGEPELLLEPGRAITSGAQILLLTVKEIKTRGGTTFAIVDGGMQNIAFPLSYEYHACLVASRVGARRHRRYFVTGPLCSPEDILYRNWTLPELVEGDVLAVMDAGAYFTSFANNFSFPRPPVVLAAGGQHRLIRRREPFEQMTALDDI
jgi:diaminopimelate decarboxylase